MNWFVLLVRTATEERVLKLLEKNLDKDIHIPFIPKKDWPHIEANNAGVRKETKICFPGYVFIKSHECVDEFIASMRPIIDNIKEAYYFLYYGENRRDISMRESERVQIEPLLNRDYYMESSCGFIEGDRVKVTSGALMGLDSRIVKINKRKRTAVIDVSMLGDTRRITLMLEVLRKEAIS